MCRELRDLPSRPSELARSGCDWAVITLISVGQLCDDGHATTFDSKGCTVKQLAGKVVATGTRSGTGLYTLDCDLPIFTTATSTPSTAETVSRAEISRASRDVVANIAVNTKPTIETWHRRLGHVNVGTVLDMARGTAVTEKETYSEEA
ncbi:hypothetical protein C8R45DRAFT_1026256 [Mycena sanguinolenta]|nr:hypothetical protein C8R45DRAFT_1026256 [Mycena sanguinolenta]